MNGNISNTGAPLTWNNWAGGGPTNFYSADCSLVSLASGQFYDDLCSQPACPVCQLEPLSPPRLMLRGLCPHLNADRFYYLAPQSRAEFWGLHNTKLTFSADRRRWEMVEMIDEEKVLAFMLDPHTNSFPLGLHSWQFTASNCSDPGEKHRDLALHLEVEEPGHFCCGDGSCIDSELVYDQVLDCLDRSDEENITFILYSDTYNRLWPPVHFVEGQKEMFNVFMNFTVIDIFDINEEKAYLDISFLLQLKWYDSDLTFQYLKNTSGEYRRK